MTETGTGGVTVLKHIAMRTDHACDTARQMVEHGAA